MLSVKEAIDRLGFKRGNFLGSGAYAEVHELMVKDENGLWVVDPTRVIKVTCDEHDAAVAELARRAQDAGGCKNVVRVYKVVKVDDTVSCPCGSMYCPRRSSYVVISERLQPVPYELHALLPHSGMGINQYHYDLFDAVTAAEKGEIDPAAHYSDRFGWWSYAALNAKGMVDDLRSLGVTYWEDFKLANVMVRPGYGIVVSDLGCTESPMPEIETIAA